MPPQATKAAFEIAIWITLSALGCLFIVQKGTPEYYVTLITLLMGALFIGIISLVVRRLSR